MTSDLLGGHFYLPMRQHARQIDASDQKHLMREKIRFHELHVLREDSDAAELVKFIAQRKGIIKVEVIADLFTICITYDKGVTTPGQISADLRGICFIPVGATILNG